MPARPVLNTVLDLLDEAASLLEEAARTENFSMSERDFVKRRLERIAVELDDSPGGNRATETA